MTKNKKIIALIATLLFFSSFGVSFSSDQENGKSKTQATVNEQYQEGYDLLTRAAEQFSKGKYDQSIMSSQHYLSQYNELSDLALFNQVRCFLKLNDKGTSKLILKRMQAAYPDSQFSQYTLERITEMPESLSILDM